MIYRKAPPHPPRMLLRVAAAAGATVVLGASACGSTAGPESAGVVDSGSDGGDEITVCHGVCVNPEAGSDAGTDGAIESGAEGGDEGGGDSAAHGLVDGGTD